MRHYDSHHEALRVYVPGTLVPGTTTDQHQVSQFGIGVGIGIAMDNLVPGTEVPGTKAGVTRSYRAWRRGSS